MVSFEVGISSFNSLEQLFCWYKGTGSRPRASSSSNFFVERVMVPWWYPLRLLANSICLVVSMGSETQCQYANTDWLQDKCGSKGM